MFRRLIILGAVFVALTSSVIAAEVPVVIPGIDFSQVLTDQSGKPITTPAPDGQPAAPFTLGVAATQALFGSYPDEQNLSGKTKFERGTLAMKLAKGGRVVLSPEDVTMIKDLIGKAYSPLVVMRAWSMLDPTKVDSTK